MSDLLDLYQDLVVDHSRRPRHKGSLPETPHRAEGDNPLCGDRLEVALELEDDRIVEARFDGQGCAISTASASLLTEALEGKTVDEARELFERFRAAVAGEAPPDLEGLGKLAALVGVREYPMRVKCATLPWHTAMAAMAGRRETVTTE